MQNLKLVSYVSVLLVIEEEKCFSTQTRPQFSRGLRAHARTHTNTHKHRAEFNTSQ